MLDGMSSDSAGGPDLDVDTGVLGVSSVAEGCEFSSYSFSTGDLDASSAEVLAESGADMSTVDYGESGDYDGNPLAESRRRSPRTSCVHVVGHAAAQTMEQLDEFVSELGLVRIPCVRVAGRDIDQRFDTLMPLSTWSDLVEKGKLGDGAYDGATGTTTVKRHYYCIPVRECPFVPSELATLLSLGKPVYDRTTRAFVEATVVTWHYAETDDYETRVVLRVLALPEGRTGSRSYFVNREPIVVLNEKVKRLARDVYMVLRAASPKLRNLQLRRKAVAGQFGATAHVAPAHVSSSLGTYGEGVVVFPA